MELNESKPKSYVADSYTMKKDRSSDKFHNLKSISNYSRITDYENAPFSNRDTMNSVESGHADKQSKSSGPITVRRHLKGLTPSFEFNTFMEVAELIELSSSSLSSNESSISYNSIEQSWVETDPRFLIELGEVPSFDRMSQIYASIGSATGRFTNPLTGSPVLSSTQFNSEEEEEGEGEEEVEIEEEEFSFEDFDKIYPKDEKYLMEETRFDEFAAEPSFGSDDRIFLKDIKVQLTHKGIEVAKNFLEELLNEVVRFCEENEEAIRITENLDKNILFSEIIHIYNLLIEERKVHAFLNRKCVEYYRRKGKIRYITCDVPDECNPDSKKYKATINRLDELLGAEVKMKEIAQEDELERTADDEEKKANDEIKNFEKMVKLTLRYEPGTRLAQVIQDCLHDMAVLRAQISQVRLVLIQRQHTISALQLKIDKLNNLGDGLQLSEYENLEIETHTLTKKIEDRKNMLAKQHDRFHTSLHTMAHINFTKEILYKKLRNASAILKQLMDDKISFRKYVNGLNVNHVRMRKQIQELTLKSGLLAKPALLKDYDKTIKNIEEQRKNVELLRQTKMDIEAKLKLSEKTKSNRKR